MRSVIANIVSSVNSVSRKLYGLCIRKVLLLAGLMAHFGVTNLIAQSPCPAAALGYQYEKTITIDYTKVIGTDQTNFPVLISLVSPQSNELRTIANGGRIFSDNGYDIIFTDENYNKLDHQIESYTATNGNLVAWVKIPLLSHTSNTSFKILYSNPQILADPSVSTVWNSGYKGVWHLNGADFTECHTHRE